MTGKMITMSSNSLSTRPRWIIQLQEWLVGERLPALLTAVTLITMLGGLLAERQEASRPLIVLLYLIAYIAGGVFGLQAGLASLRQLTIDVDMLMVLAALGAAAVGAPFEGAMLLFLFSLSNVLQEYALDRTRNAIRALMALRPTTALIQRQEETVTLPLEEVCLGDVMIVRPGDRLALDGLVIAGESSVDQATITGESIPVSKRVGDMVLAGTINQRGHLEVEVTHLAADTTLARLIKLVEEAHSEKAHTQRFIEKAEQYYALGVILMTLSAIVLPLLLLDERPIKGGLKRFIQ